MLACRSESRGHRRDTIDRGHVIFTLSRVLLHSRKQQFYQHDSFGTGSQHYHNSSAGKLSHLRVGMGHCDTSLTPRELASCNRNRLWTVDWDQLESSVTRPRCTRTVR